MAGLRPTHQSQTPLSPPATAPSPADGPQHAPGVALSPGLGGSARGLTDKDPVLAAHLAEYQSLRQEVTSRFDWQRQAFAYLAVIATAGATLISASTRGFPLALSPLAVLLPLITVPLGLIFFDNELVIWGMYHYLGTHLRRNIGARIAGMEPGNTDHRWVLMLEQRRFHDLPDMIRSCHQLLSIGRWFFFLVPTVGPIIYASVHIGDWWDGAYHWWYRSFYVLDYLLLLALLWGIAMAIRARRLVWKAQEEVYEDVEHVAPAEPRPAGGD